MDCSVTAPKSNYTCDLWLAAGFEFLNKQTLYAGYSNILKEFPSTIDACKLEHIVPEPFLLRELSNQISSRKDVWIFLSGVLW